MRAYNFAGRWGVCLLSVLIAATVLAQARRAPTPSGAVPVQPAKAREPVVIKKMEAVGQACRVKTPEFRNDANEPAAPAREWARITLKYETNLDWIDELEFRFSVVLKDAKANAFIMFPGSVTYVDIAKGKQHQSTVFLRPATLERYGEIIWAGVKVYLNGELLATAQSPDDQRPWTINYKTREGVLLNRDQTPFALVAIDNHGTIKPK
ncbi:MAG: hypothetical protein HYV35_02020 [Lentisphaerae bacterium]|nr:hypothetical protein [Lentisphaerota bacterium]